MGRTAKVKTVEIFYRVREVKSGTLFNNYSGSPWTTKTSAQKECDKKNKTRIKSAVLEGYAYEVVTYEMKEVNRTTKIDKLLLSDSDAA